MNEADRNTSEDPGVERSPPEVVEALGVPARRGHHLALLAGEGSGKEALLALAVRERCEAGGGPQALVLRPTWERALESARGLAALLADSDLEVRALREERDDPGAADILVARPGVLLPRVRSGRLSLAGLKLLALDGVEALRRLGEWESVEPLLDTAGEDTQRIAITTRMDEELRALLERALPRARRWPEELFRDESPRADAPLLQFATGASLAERAERLAELARGEETVAVHCLEAATAPEVAARLRLRGLAVRETSAGRLRVAARAEAAEEAESEPAGATGEAAVRAEPEAVLLLGLPAGLGALRERLGGARRRAAVVTAEEVPQLRLLAARAGWRAVPAGGPAAAEEPASIAAFRRDVERELQAAGNDPELLVLEPLLREHGTTGVAAALSAMLRRARKAEPAIRPWADVEAASHRAVEAPARGARPAWTRLWIGAGKRDEIRPADLVGAITGETGLVGGQIGKIDIRHGFSLVDIDSQVVDQVIRQLDGASIRGRTVSVRRDREA